MELGILVILGIAFFLIIIFVVLDYWTHKKWLADTVESINKIFDGVKTFFFVTVVDRIAAAFDNTESEEEDSDDSLEA